MIKTLRVSHSMFTRIPLGQKNSSEGSQNRDPKNLSKDYSVGLRRKLRAQASRSRLFNISRLVFLLLFYI